MMGNRNLAVCARDVADAAAPGSLERRAYGCAAVALATTGTLQAARKALGNVSPADVQTAALAALGELERATSPEFCPQREIHKEAQ